MKTFTDIFIEISVNKKILFKRVKSINKSKGSLTFDTFDFGDFSLRQMASKFKTSSSGKPKNVWKVFDKNKGIFISPEIRNLKKAKEIGSFIINKKDKLK